MQKVIFRDKECYVCEGRLKPEDIVEGYNYYAMRHEDDDWSEPVTIEEKVFVNYFGAIACKEEIVLDNEWSEGRFETQLTEEESELLAKAASDNMSNGEIDESQEGLTLDNLYE